MSVRIAAPLPIRVIRRHYAKTAMSRAPALVNLFHCVKPLTLHTPSVIGSSSVRCVTTNKKERHKRH